VWHFLFSCVAIEDTVFHIEEDSSVDISQILPFYHEICYRISKGTGKIMWFVK